MKHELVELAQRIDWKSVEKDFAPYYADMGRPAVPVRKMVGSMLLKQMYGLSDELGGAKNGPLVSLDAAYHQQITNAFRQAWPFGKGPITDPVLRRQIMDQIYRQLPLPPGFTY